MIFADTCFWIAVFSKADHLHILAHQKLEEAEAKQTQIITSEMIFDEFLTNFAESSLRTYAVEFVESLFTRPNLITIEQTHELFVQALAFYKKYNDKGWSFTDCASFVIMGEQKLQKALTEDHHFEQAGFQSLLK